MYNHLLGFSTTNTNFDFDKWIYTQCLYYTVLFTVKAVSSQTQKHIQREQILIIWLRWLIGCIYTSFSFSTSKCVLVDLLPWGETVWWEQLGQSGALSLPYLVPPCERWSSWKPSQGPCCLCNRPPSCRPPAGSPSQPAALLLPRLFLELGAQQSQITD